jgi:ganglioside-induced differentiation-associated protein 1
MFELYHHGTSVCAAKPRIVFAEKGLEWKAHYVDILAGEQFKPEYLKLNPKAVVPTLVHDGKVIRESTLICEYIDEVHPEPPLRPSTPYGRYEMRMWSKRIDEEVHPATTPITYAISHRHVVISHGPKVVEEYINKLGPLVAEKRRRRIELGIDDEDAKNSLKVWDKFLADMEATLSKQPWLAGDKFTLAECCVIPFINRLDMLQLNGMWEGSRPHIADWFARVKKKPWFEPMMYGYCPVPLRKLMEEKGREAWPKAKAILTEA